MTNLPILRPGDIDGRWLTQVLQMNGVDAIVKSSTKKNVGTGQIGDSVRFTLTYERDAPNAPRSLVGKFPSPDDTSRNTGIGLGNYNREVQFYKDLAHRAGIATPKCYYTDIDERHEFVLIMEDLAPADQGDQLKGVTIPQARLVMEEAAKLHASFWNDDHIETLPYVSGSRASQAAGGAAVGNDMVVGLWHAFKARYGSRLEKDCEEIGDTLCSHFADQAALHPGPKCLTHNDFRPDNMMFATPAGGHPFMMLDWQSFAVGTGAVDVAYFLAGAITREERHKHETELLTLYHDKLKALGVKNYSFDDLKGDYSTGAFLLFFTAFFASMVVVQTERGDDMFFQMIRSSSNHIIDHDALNILKAV